MAAIATAMALTATPAAATHVGCGDTITQSTTLDSDLTNCPRDGIVIGASNVMLDLGGHTVAGSGGYTGVRDFGFTRVAVRNGTVRDFGAGVDLYQARDSRIEYMDISSVTGIHVGGQPSSDVVRANSVAGGILVEESYWFSNQTFRPTDNRIEQNIVTPHPSSFGGSGITLRMVDRNAVAQNVVTGGAIVVLGDIFTHNGSDENTLSANSVVVPSINAYSILLSQDCTRNDVFGNQVFGASIGIMVTVSCNGNFVRENRVRSTARYGIGISPNGYRTSGNLVHGNDVQDSGVDGISVSNLATDTVVTGNLASQNGDDGIQIDDPGTGVAQNTANRNGDLGIEAVPGTLDRGGNVAKQNGNPAQCVNVACAKSGKP